MKRKNDGALPYYTTKKAANKGNSKSPIPYAVSQPNKFWRIKKGLPPADYWRKRYYRRRITGRGDYRMDPEQSFGRRWGGYLGSKLGEYAEALRTVLLQILQAWETIRFERTC